MKKPSGIADKCCQLAPYFILAVFAVVTALSLFMCCDDFIWYFVGMKEKLAEFRHPNGRYLSNFLTILLVRYPLLRHCFVSAAIALLVVLMARLIGTGRKLGRLKLCYALSALIIIPSPVFREVILWISGFTNYVFSLVLTLIYLAFIFKALFTDYKLKAYHLVLFPALALAAGLSVEHIAIYDIALGAAVIVLLRVRRGKLYAAPILYLIASIAAICIMFTNKVYSKIAETGDELTVRTFNTDPSDIFQNFVYFITPAYSKSLWVVNVVIAAALLLICRNASQAAKKSKYTPVCMAITVMYAAYSVFCSTVSPFVILSTSMRIRGVEAAFTFLYLVSLAYLIWVFFDSDRKIRLYICLISTVMLTAPLVVISPASPRCFFTEYVFWILLGGELLFAALGYLGLTESRLAILLSSCIAAYAAIFMLNIEVTNKYYNVKRIELFKEQISEGRETDISILELPYPDYAYDDFPKPVFFESELTDGITYFTLIYDYYGIDAYDLKYSDFTFVSPYDYNLMRET